MIRNLLSLAVTLAVLTAVPSPSVGQAPVDHPRIRASLHELREARKHLNDARDTWPPGHKDQAAKALDSAIKTLRTILAVDNVDTFRGVDRNPEYYTRYKDHPRLRAALADIRDGRDELRASKTDFGGLREQAIDDLDVAAGSLVLLIRHGK